jgi:HSP90 family molecular chaperone
MMSVSNAFFNKIKNNGKEESVTTNQLALIKKMLSRYSSDFVVFRELIQNSDDAQAKSVQLQFICDPPSDSTDDQHITTNHQRNGLFGNIGKFFRSRFQNTEESSDEEDDESINHVERKFHNKIITEIRIVNDGLVFTEKDWKRVATIAEGNTNVDAIGQFGVGFFTVFSYSDKPMIKSGKHCMAFDWKDDKSLTTFRDKLPVEEQSTTTSVILIMRDKYILDTKSTNNIENEQSVTVSSNVKKQLDTKNNVVPKINLTQLKVYFLKGKKYFLNIF